MQASQLTLDAALRDASATRPDARDKAIANLAPALLGELSRAGPAWRAADDHPRGAEVVAAFVATLSDQEAPASRRGMAAIGLGTIGEPSLISRIESWLTEDSNDEARVFLRECALIAISFVGTAAPQAAPERARALAEIRNAMGSPHPDVRYQAAVALVEVAGNTAEAELVQALDAEAHASVRDNLVAALGRLDPPGPAACAALARLLDSDEGPMGIGFAAAMALAGARHPRARPRLLDSLPIRAERDLALEALAALGAAEAADCDRVLAIARRWWLPGVTRVRAAYALVRMLGPDRGREARAMLGRFAWHPRPAVREAVADAQAALAKLGP